MEFHQNMKKVLDKILSLEEENAPIKHLKKFEMVKIIKGGRVLP